MNRQLLEVLVSSSVLILALSAMRLVLRGKNSPRLQYGLWLLVAVRLLVPVSIGESPASVMNYVPEQAMVQALEQTPAPVQRTQTPTAAPAAQPAAASAASDETPGSQTDAPDTMQAQQTQQVAKQNAAQAQPHHHAGRVDQSGGPKARLPLCQPLSLCQGQVPPGAASVRGSSAGALCGLPLCEGNQ